MEETHHSKWLACNISNPDVLRWHKPSFIWPFHELAEAQSLKKASAPCDLGVLLQPDISPMLSERRGVEKGPSLAHRDKTWRIWQLLRRWGEGQDTKKNQLSFVDNQRFQSTCATPGWAKESRVGEKSAGWRPKGGLSSLGPLWRHWKTWPDCAEQLGQRHVLHFYTKFTCGIANAPKMKKKQWGLIFQSLRKMKKD